MRTLVREVKNQSARWRKKTELAMAATPDDVDNVTPKDDVSNVIQHFNYNLQQAAQLMCECVKQ